VDGRRKDENSKNSLRVKPVMPIGNQNMFFSRELKVSQSHSKIKFRGSKKDWFSEKFQTSQKEEKIPLFPELTTSPTK